MNKKNGYRILFYLVNTLFWLNVFSSCMIGLMIIYFKFDDSILQNSSFNVSLAKGLLHIHFNEYPGTKLAQLAILSGFISSVFSIAMLWSFKTLFRNAAKGVIFTSSNTKAIFSIGIILLIGSIISKVPSFYIATKLAPLVHLTNATLNISYSIDKTLFIASVFILLLGAFFKKAVKIAEENELTV